MLRFKAMSWAHALSYGPKNQIDFTNPLVQLVGKNGHGKSSIANILEEVLYNKNSKGIKKGAVLNRYSNAKAYTIELYFEKNGDEYLVKTVRGATQKVELFKNGEDISSHTSTGTYKLIEEIIGYDHKTFTQIVYQSNAFSLEFLTATDTARKKFLIDLLSLDRYTEVGDKIKVDLKDKTQEIELLNMKLNTVNSWLSKLKAEDLVYKTKLFVPDPATEESLRLAEFKESLRTIELTNKRIQQNNTYKQLLANLGDVSVMVAPTYDILSAKVKQAELTKTISSLKSAASTNAPSKCSSCGQPIDNSRKVKLAEEAAKELPVAQKELETISKEIVSAEIHLREYKQSTDKLQEVEKYSGLINHSVGSELLDKEEILNNISKLEMILRDNESLILSATKANQAIDSHNAKADVLNAQMQDMMKDKQELSDKLALVSEVHASLQILAKTFSPSGFIAYKIESSIKDLEQLTNTYLAEMSDGRFQLSFQVSASDKLDVIITDNGTDIDISALSNGELARVNVSTLLAIRKLLESLSDTRTNLLILDETVESLDAEGKEKLIEVLLSEEYLNTILVSHGFTHPLLTKLEIVKENNISRIEQ